MDFANIDRGQINYITDLGPWFDSWICRSARRPFERPGTWPDMCRQTGSPLDGYVRVLLSG